MLFVFILITLCVAAAASFTVGYGAGKVGRKRDRTAERVIAEVHTWFLRNADVYPEAALSIQDILANYYNKKEN